MSINKLYKLSSGETIITIDIIEELLSNDTKYVTLTKPLAIMMQPNHKGGIEFGVMPWMHGDVIIKADNIIAYSNAPDELDKEYIKLTTSIQLAH